MDTSGSIQRKHLVIGQYQSEIVLLLLDAVHLTTVQLPPLHYLHIVGKVFV